MGLKVMMFFVCLSHDKDRLVDMGRTTIRLQVMPLTLWLCSDSAREYSKIKKYINNKWITT